MESSMTFSVAHFPKDLLVYLTSLLPDSRDAYSLALVNKRFSSILASVLSSYKYKALFCDERMTIETERNWEMTISVSSYFRFRHSGLMHGSFRSFLVPLSKEEEKDLGAGNKEINPVSKEGQWINEKIKEKGLLVLQADYNTGQKHGEERIYRARVSETHTAAAPLKPARTHLRTVTNWLDGKRHGDDCSYDESGQIRVKNHWVSGRLHGIKEKWDIRGTKILSANWCDGKQQGQEIAYNKFGTKVFEWTFVDGLKQGEEIAYSPGGEKIFSRNWVDDLKQGEEIQWCPNSGLKIYSRNWEKGKKQGEEVQWEVITDEVTKTSTLNKLYSCHWVDDCKNGPEERFDHGKKTVTIWKDGKKVNLLSKLTTTLKLSSSKRSPREQLDPS